MVKRIPIKVQRTPIKLPQRLKVQLKIWELMEITKEDDIYELSKHYDMLMMKVTNKAGYNSLSLKDPTSHKNWVHFESVYEICRMKGWDAKLYIEGQFERAKNWKHRGYPLPNMMYSENALWFMTNYISSIRQKYQQDTQGGKKEKGRETRSLRIQVVEGIISSVEMLSDNLKKGKFDSMEQAKALKIFNSWEVYSPYYLWSVPWFHDVLSDLEGKKVEEVKHEFDRIHDSKMIREAIKETVQRAEEYYNIPANIQF